MIVCVAGSPSIDKLFEVDRLVPGDIHRPKFYLEVPGGKGLNVARAAAALGASVIATGVLAGPAGRWLETSLSSYGVSGRFAWAEGQTRSSLSVLDHETGRLTEFYEAPNPAEGGAWDEVVATAESLLPEASWCVLSGTLPLSLPADTYANLIGRVRAAGACTAVDVRGATLAAAVDAGPDLVKINHHEACELLEHSVAGVDGAAEAAAEIRSRAGGAGHAAAVTLGAEGAVLIDASGCVLHGRIPVEAPYPVGSGDAFLGGLLAARDRGSDWQSAFAQALGAGAANAEMPGAGRLDPARAAELAESCELLTLSR